MTKTYVGQCIYCRVFASVEDPLSDEHIFPLGLFGKGVLAKASCKKCAAITSDFEGKVLKEDMAGVRSALGFPSRRKNKRRGTNLPMEVVARDGEVKTIQVSPEDYIPILALPVFKPPAFETKIPYDGGIELVGYVSNPSKRSAKKLAAEHDAKEIAVYGLRWPEAWARMFAKIAYALAVRDYGLDRLKIDDVYVLGAILGKTNDIGMWVGCVEKQVYDAENFGHQTAGLWLKDGEVHAVIKLFGWLDTVPEYQVILGKLSP